MQNSSFKFNDIDISDASISIPKFNDEGVASTVPSTPYKFNLTPKKYTPQVESKLDTSDFVISESDQPKQRSVAHQTPRRVRGGSIEANILSPQISASEVKRHFKDFSSAFPMKSLDDSPLFDRSIEVGRAGPWSHANSPIPHKVMGDRFPLRSKSNEKVTSSTSSPKLGEARRAAGFKIPNGYTDDASFFEKLGMKNPLTGVKSRGTTANDPVTLPDISGLSSIFSSEESSKPKGPKKSTQHKTLLSVPLDSDEKGKCKDRKCKKDYTNNNQSTIFSIFQFSIVDYKIGG